MGKIEISGVADNAIAPVCGRIASQNPGQLLIITPAYTEAKRVGTDLSFFVDRNIMIVPAERLTVLNYEARNKEGSNEKLRILKTAAEDKNAIVICPVSETIKKLPPADFFQKNKVEIKTGEDLDIRELATKLVDMGYSREAAVYAPGQFSLRGGILDVFTPYDMFPYRLDFFGDEAETVRTFDPETQRSLNDVEGFTIYPASFLPEGVPSYMENFMENVYEDSEFITEYYAGNTVVINPKRCGETAEAICEREQEALSAEIQDGRIEEGIINRVRTPEYFQNLCDGEKNLWCLSPFEQAGEDAFDERHAVNCTSPMSYNGRMDMLEKDLRTYDERGFKVTVSCSTEERYDNLKKFLIDRKLPGTVKLKAGTLSAGAEFPDEKICYISDNDIFGRKTASGRRRSGKQGSTVSSFTDLKAGDYVVHENHGIGLYRGIQQLTAAGITGDYLKIEYGGNDMLYVPVDQMNLIQKYVGSDGTRPRVNRLAGNEWKNTKAKAKAAVAELAGDLIQVIAERQAKQGFAFEPDSPWQKEFEDKFSYEETPDQLRCAAEIKEDMEKPWPMDRLLCGDVGYGKTEVAARAIFKAVENGKQVAVLVPTTLLANQHYNNFTERFEGFPFNIEMLSRYRTKKEQEETCRNIEAGVADIVIGTHRILSRDVKFKDLGLLVVDEEQRFGVAHKEKIKQMKATVDVLTLSATPIPRTLHMSLVGMRDMSVIEEPPEGRYPVQTYVMDQDDMLIRDAIEREMDRDGQVYVVYNSIKSIERVADNIRHLVPEAVVATGHGRMNEAEMEDMMLRFINGEIDVLISTTIIESGIDIPNVNTLIVLDADRYGLSQLYQLRGRVGRSKRLAYAYLMHKKEKTLTEVAEKRLRAIKDFTQFGAGFKIAMRDLEIRGAGNILGAEQSGHIVNVGYELYCKMVDDAVRALKGEPVKNREKETAVDLKVEAYIPGDYIDDSLIKLDIYKKIASVEDEDEAVKLREEMRDRFGHIPEATENLIEISLIRAAGAELSLSKINRNGQNLVLDYGRKDRKPVRIILSGDRPVTAETREILDMLKARQTAGGKDTM